MDYKLVLFDLDGTLIDTIDDLGAAVNHALSLRGFPLHDRDQYKNMVGHGVRQLVVNALPVGSSDAMVDECLADFKQYYTSHIDVFTRPYEGMGSLLEDLQKAGAVLAVASNKFQSGTETLVKKFFAGIDFCAICGNREGFPLKPDPALVESIICEASRRAGRVISRDEIVMVGDSATDMKTAENSGIAAIAVSWGFRDKASLSDAPLVVDDCSALRSALGLPAQTEQC